MTINVYWACTEDQWMLSEKPDPIAPWFYKKGLSDKNEPSTCINYCPAFNSNLNNLFALRSLYDYEFTVDENGISTPMYDQKFFEDHVFVRSIPKRFFSFKNRYIFFTDEPSLETTFYEYPFLEDNNVSQRCMPVSGKFDIGKWFRNTEFAFYLKNNHTTFKIEQKEIYSYIRFHTTKKINFIQFRYTDKLNQYNNDGFSLNFNGYLKTLENYYKMFRNKRLILKEIKENLV